MSRVDGGEEVDVASLRDLAVAVAREAGALLTDGRPERLHVETKSTPTDAVTEMDRASEQLIVARILENRPHDGVLGEEGSSRDGTSGVRWIIDPLDGTVNYLYGLPAYSVSIAAEIGGDTVAGAVFDARTGGVYEAVRGSGARYEGQPLACSTATDLGMALIGTGFGYDPDRRAWQGRIAADMLPHIRDIRRVGSAALDLCAVAAGSLDGYFEWGIQPWDRAAGLLIAEEAGAQGVVMGDRDVELTVCAPPSIFGSLLARSGAPAVRS